MVDMTKLPALFVREIVIFPAMSVTLTIGREASRLAILAAKKNYKGRVLSFTQVRAEDVEVSDLSSVFSIGVICRIENLVELTDGGMQVQVLGLRRFKADSLEWENKVPLISGANLLDTDIANPAEWEAVLGKLSRFQPETFDKVAWLNKTNPLELQRVNKCVANRQIILEEPLADERLRLLRVVLEESADDFD